VGWVDFTGLFRSHWLLRALVPGQVAWDNALTAFENGEYGSGAAYLAAMLGEQALTAYMAKAFSIYESEICSAANSVPKRTKLYRAVSEAEFKQINRTEKFEAGPNSLGGNFCWRS